MYCKGEKQHQSLSAQWPSFDIHVLGFFDQNGNEIDINKLDHLTVVSAIANPESFYQVVTRFRSDFQTKAFLDHHAFTVNDFDDVKGSILMTQKDFVKCENFKNLDIYYCKIEANLEKNELEKITQTIFG